MSTPRYLTLAITAAILIPATCLLVSHTREDIFRRPVPNFVRTDIGDRTTFTPEEKQRILQIVNSYRSIVEPPATGMRELMWDEDLEEFAKDWTQKCIGTHSHRNMTKKWMKKKPHTWKVWDYMGEALYYNHGSKYSIEEAFWMFWNEGKDYDINEPKCTHKYTCGHYQVITTAKAHRVGCALNKCQRFSKSTYPTPAIFIACLFDARYFEDARPYEVGERCSACGGSGYSFQYCRHGLCISPYMRKHNSGYDGSTDSVGVTGLQ
ncbi:GLIPR1-like protein 1 [Physella acuta]|uniref:GLIPR1-like protein 1 n=1 Tax=Physella acuta TaxID=109671 RepID=UPI0027DAE034|nr:GLIPR1-like protein 1 [Physella acuta]XP_059138860.1 GLIPR1-like protein 1 [Physella acuta]XP_059138861.1 GLIPR1-like protein 1 [Physella acuta]XP_059138862.1 GLIPR1-like protein 1 [Physella acuta]